MSRVAKSLDKIEKHGKIREYLMTEKWWESHWILYPWKFCCLSSDVASHWYIVMCVTVLVGKNTTKNRSAKNSKSRYRWHCSKKWFMQIRPTYHRKLWINSDKTVNRSILIPYKTTRHKFSCKSWKIKPPSVPFNNARNFFISFLT